MENKKEETYSETRTLEQLLRDLRIEKNWNYEDVSNIGAFIFFLLKANSFYW